MNNAPWQNSFKWRVIKQICVIYDFLKSIILWLMSLAVALQTYQTTYVWTLTEIEVWYGGPVPGAEMSSWSIFTERHTLTSCQVIFHQPPFGAVDVQADLLSPHVEGSHQVSVDWQSLVCANSTVWNLLCCPTEGHLVPNFTVLCFPCFFFVCFLCEVFDIWSGYCVWFLLPGDLHRPRGLEPDSVPAVDDHTLDRLGKVLSSW